MDRVSSAEPSELTPGSTRSYMSHQEALCLETETASPPAAAHRACWQLRWGQTPHTTPNNPSAPSGAPACPTEPMVCQGQKALQPARPGPARLGSLRGESVGHGAGRASFDFCSCPQTPAPRALACGALEVGGGQGGGEPPRETGGWGSVGCGGDRTGRGVGPPGPPYASQASGLWCQMGPVIKIACRRGRNTQVMSFFPFVFKLRCSTLASHASRFLG